MVRERGVRKGSAAPPGQQPMGGEREVQDKRNGFRLGEVIHRVKPNDLVLRKLASVCPVVFVVGSSLG
jgi:hypothetical protein